MASLLVLRYMLTGVEPALLRAETTPPKPGAAPPTKPADPDPAGRNFEPFPENHPPPHAVEGTNVKVYSARVARYLSGLMRDLKKAIEQCNETAYKNIVRSLEFYGNQKHRLDHDPEERTEVSSYVERLNAAPSDKRNPLKQEAQRFFDRDAQAIKRIVPPPYPRPCQKKTATTQPPPKAAPGTKTTTPPPEPDVPGLDDEPKPPAGGERVTPGQPPARPGEPPRAPTTVFPTGWEPFAPAMLAAAATLPFLDVSFALGVRNNFADGAYMSNGTQPSGVGTGEKGNANFGLYFGGYIPLLDLENYFDVVGIDGYSSALFALSSLYAGGRFEITHLGGGNKVVLELIRHGPTGAVRLTEQERTMISFLFLLRQLIYVNNNYGGFGWFSLRREAARGDQYADAGLAEATRARWPRWWPVAIHVGAGPSFVDTKITMTSNQVPGGGVFESARQRRWDTGWSFVAGAQTPLCRNCVFGSPLVFGVEGQWTWLPAREISVRSSTFGFTESGRVSGRSSSRVMFTLSVPFTVGR